MVLEHIPWGVVLDENVTLEKLKPFPVVILPDARSSRTESSTMLRRYVEEGGSLILTGWTGLLGQRGEPLEHPAIESLIGAQCSRRLDSRDNHVRFASGKDRPAEAMSLTTDLEPDWPFLVEGPAAVYRPTTATPIGELLQPHRTARQRKGVEGTDWPMSAGAAVGPAVLLNRLGKGRVLTFAASPDFATAGEHPIIEARTLLANAVRTLLPHPRLRVDAPSFVEVVASDEPSARRLHVHLIAYSPTPATTPPRNRPFVVPGLIEDAPSYQAKLHLRESFVGTKGLNKDTQILSGPSVREVGARRDRPARQGNPRGRDDRLLRPWFGRMPLRLGNRRGRARNTR